MIVVLNKKSCRYNKIKKSKTQKQTIVKHKHFKTLHDPIEMNTTHHTDEHKYPIHKTSYVHFNYFIPNYNPHIRFLVYSKSSDKPYPGTGFNEHIKEEEKPLFKYLSTLDDWRKKLDYYWVEPFEFDGKHWNTVEHFYQASKFKKHTDFYNLFTLESNSIICTDPILANHAGGKEGKINRKKFRPNHVTIDKHFYDKHLDRLALIKANYAKFSQHLPLKNILLATRDAMLHHFDNGKVEAMYSLMRVRDMLNKH